MILITGASGFLGRSLTAALCTHCPQDPLRLFDAIPPPVDAAGARIGRNTHVSGDITDVAAVSAAVIGARAVVHLAAVVQPNSRDGKGLTRVNVEGSRLVYAAAVNAGCELFVHLSSAGIYGPPRRREPFTEVDHAQPATPYQQSKWEAEQALLAIEHGSTTLNILRPAGLYGAGSRLEIPAYRRVLRERWSLEMRGGIVVHPTHVNDVVEAIVALIASPARHSNVFNVGGERPVLFQDFQAEVAAVIGVRRRRIVVPPLVATPVAIAADRVLTKFGRPRRQLVEISQGHTFSAAVDDRLLREQYPGLPIYPLERGLREHIAWARRERLI